MKKANTNTEKIDSEFFDSDWLFDHKGWFDAGAYTRRATQNQFKATPSVIRFSRTSDDRLDIYKPGRNIQQLAATNIMVAL